MHRCQRELLDGELQRTTTWAVANVPANTSFQFYVKVADSVTKVLSPTKYSSAFSLDVHYTY